MAAIEILLQDEAMIAVAKPAGRIVIPGRGAAATEPCLRDEIGESLGTRLHVVHRLDRGTSGVLLFARDAAAHRALSLAFQRHAVDKRYLALCRGELLGSGEIERDLVRVRGGRVRAARPGERTGKRSRTGWRAVERFAGFTWVEFHPHEGRLHQVRVHAALLGFPLAVDPDYGQAAPLRARDLDSTLHGGEADAIAIDRVPLHAASLRVAHPRSGKPVSITCPLPLDLSRALAVLRARRARRA